MFVILFGWEIVLDYTKDQHATNSLSVTFCIKPFKNKHIMYYIMYHLFHYSICINIGWPKPRRLFISLLLQGKYQNSKIKTNKTTNA